jgi:hypothetical protein
MTDAAGDITFARPRTPFPEESSSCEAPVHFISAAAGLVLLVGAAPVHAQDESRAVQGGGIAVPGWKGVIDAREASRGQVLENARFALEGEALHATTGPAVTYWNPANTASGTYTVTATFREPKYMSLNNHPHPYGIVIAGNDMGTDQQSYLYCAAYGSGTFIVRGFGPEPFQVNGARPKRTMRSTRRRAGPAGHAGDRRLRARRQGRLLDQRHGRRQLRQVRRRR